MITFGISQAPVYSVLVDRPRQVIDNFGASDAWTVEPLIHWPEKDRNRIADLLFDVEKGIGLSGWRYNLGGGINHESIDNPTRTVDTFEVSPGTYDWNRTPGQRWMLEAARKRGVPNFVAFVNSPPRSLTRNGLTNGTDGDGSTNLRPGAEGQFAAYLADILTHFRDAGYPFGYVSPINEPVFEWNGKPRPGNQEGSRASNSDIVRIDAAVAEELRRRNLPVELLGPEATSPQVGYEVDKGMTKKYGSEYGDYAALLEQTPTWRPIYAYHAYWGDRFEQIVPFRRKLRATLDKTPGVRAWQTEYCQLTGPRGEGGWGRDLGMTLALNVARLIHFDLTLVEASSWSWWLAVSDGDYKDGLVYVDDLAAKNGTIFPSKALWALGNFSRFVRPGFRRLELEGPSMNVNSVLVSAYQSPKKDQIVIVLINPTTKSEPIGLHIPGLWKARPYATSDRPGEDLKPLGKVDPNGSMNLPSRTVMTLVCDPAKL